MAKVTATLPDDVIKQFSQLSYLTDGISEKMLKAGGDVALQKVKGNLAASVGSGTKYDSRSTGELQKSLGLSPVKVDSNGNYDIKVGFSEPRSDGGSNAKLANIIEYGKSGQKAKPFIKPAKSSCKADVEAAMKETFEREVDKL